MDVIPPEQMVGNNRPRRVDDGNRSAEREHLVALEVQKGRKCMRESGGFVRRVECRWYHDRAGRNVRAGSAGRPQTQADDGSTPKVNSQDDAPLCFRPFKGYYSSRASRRLDSTGSP